MAFTETLEKDEEREKREAFLNELRGGGRVENLAADMLAEDLKLKRERDSERLKYDEEYEHTENQLSIAESELAKARAGRPTPLAFPTEEETQELGGHPKNITAALGLTPKERTSDQNAALKKYRSKQGAEAQKRKVAEKEELDAYIAKKEKPAESKVAREKRFLFDIKRGDKKLEEVFSPEDLKKYRERKDSDWKIFLAAEASRTAAANNATRTRLGKSEYAKAIEEDPITKTDKLLQTFSLGFLNPADQKEYVAAGRAGSAVADFDAAIKLDRATSSAKSARIGAALGTAEIESIVAVMTGMNDNANLKYFNEVRAKSGSFFKNFLNVAPDATPAQERAAQERVIWLARQGNETALLQVEALASQYNSFAAARKLTVAGERVAAQKRSDALWSDAVAAQQVNATNWGKKAVDEDGIFQPSRLPAHVLESMQDGKGNRTLFGDHVLAGADAIIIGESAATRTQIRENRSEAEEVANQLGNYLGFAPVPFDSQTLSRKTSLTNRKNIDDLREKLATAKEYTKVMGEPPAFVKNNINFRNSLLKQKAELQEELEGVDRFSEKGADIGFALGRLNRSLVKTDIEIQTSFERMAATTEEIKEGDKTAADVAKTTLLAKQKAGQDRMDAFRKLINVDKLEASAMGIKTDGVGKGGGFFEFAFFKQDGKGGYSDVKDVFRPWLDTHTLVSKGGIPVLGGFLPDDLTKKSNAYVFKPDGPDVETGTFVRDWTNEAQRIVYDGALDQWADEYGQFKKQEPEVGGLGEGMTGEEGMEQPPEMTEPVQPLIVPTPPAPAALNIPVSPEVALGIELEANKLMKGVGKDADNVPYKNNQRVTFKDKRYPDSVRGRTFIFKLDENGNPYWLLLNK